MAIAPVKIRLHLDPDLALALFIAPVLLDAAYDTSLRDLKHHWAPVASLVLIAVGLTTVAVALVVHALAPTIPIETHVTVYPLEKANEALDDLREGRLRGSAVLAMA